MHWCKNVQTSCLMFMESLQDQKWRRLIDLALDWLSRSYIKVKSSLKLHQIWSKHINIRIFTLLCYWFHIIQYKVFGGNTKGQLFSEWLLDFKNSFWNQLSLILGLKARGQAKYGSGRASSCQKQWRITSIILQGYQFWCIMIHEHVFIVSA